MTKKSFDVEKMRIPPHSEDAEMAVLAGILSNNRVFDKVSELVISDDFYHPNNKQIFKTMGELHNENQAIDMITVKSKMESKKQKIDVAYLAKLGNYLGYEGIESHCKIIKEKAILRNVIITAHEAMQSAYLEPDDVSSLVQTLEQKFFNIGQKKEARDSILVKDLIVPTMDRFDFAKKNKGHVLGLETGLTDLDKMTTGFNVTDYIILAGRPSMGKTSLAINIGCYVTINQKLPVLFFSLEMGRAQVGERILCLVAKADYHKLRQGYGSNEEWARISSKIGEIADAPFLINDNAAISLNFLRSQIRKVKSEYPNLALVIIDYIQLMSYPQARSREEAISELSKGIKALCKELEMPIVAVSQLNRQVEMRGDQNPRLSDLRESGTLEQDADMVLFVWHEPDQQYGKGSLSKIKIGKQRNGPVGTVETLFFRESMRFENKGQKLI